MQDICLDIRLWPLDGIGAVLKTRGHSLPLTQHGLTSVLGVPGSSVLHGAGSRLRQRGDVDHHRARQSRDCRGVRGARDGGLHLRLLLSARLGRRFAIAVAVASVGVGGRLGAVLAPLWRGLLQRLRLLPALGLLLKGWLLEADDLLLAFDSRRRVPVDLLLAAPLRRFGRRGLPLLRAGVLLFVAPDGRGFCVLYEVAERKV